MSLSPLNTLVAYALSVRAETEPALPESVLDEVGKAGLKYSIPLESWAHLKTSDVLRILCSELAPRCYSTYRGGNRYSAGMLRVTAAEVKEAFNDERDL